MKFQCALTVIVAVLAGFAEPPVHADLLVPAGFRPFPLQYAEPQEIALELRKALSSSAKILVDQQNQRVLVQAREEDSRMASALIRNLDRMGRNQAIDSDFERRSVALLEPGNAAPADQPVTRRLVQLRHVSSREFEEAMQRVWGNQLTFVAQENGDASEARFKSPQHTSLELHVDRRRNQVYLQAFENLADAWEKAISAIDRPAQASQDRSALVRLGNADPAMVRKAIADLQTTAEEKNAEEKRVAVPLDRRGRDTPVGRLAAMLFQPEADAQQQLPEEDNADGEDEVGDTTGLFGNVKLQFLEGLDIVIVSGRPADVERVRQILEQIQLQAAQTQPEIRVYHLRYINSRSTADLLIELYEQVYSTRQGPVSITALIKPNALLLVGREDNVNSLVTLLRQLDQPVPPQTQFEVFRLKFMSAVDAEARLLAFYQGQATAGTPAQEVDLTGLAQRVRVVADYRSNSLIVQASPRDMAEVARFVRQLDVEENMSLQEVRIFKLTNSLAEELAPVLQDALSGQIEGAGRAQSGQGALQPATAGNTLSRVRSAMLSFMTVDKQNGGELLKSGITFDVRVVSDTSSNSLIVIGPGRSMELIGALIRELDQLPDAEAQIKVFTILNGDATNLAIMLQQLFGQEVTVGTGAVGQAAFLRAATAGAQQQVSAGGAEGSLVPLRFAVDQRTNSIIASGGSSDLIVVETILARLDEGDIVDRKFTVYKLRHTFAVSVANSITQVLTAQSQLFQQQFQTTGILSPFEQFQREVIVVPEEATNSLIISASPRFFDEIVKVIEDLDTRPPMVIIQCLIAEVAFDDTTEFGIEAGIQDSLVFDRGVGVIGFPFNQAGLGNNSDALALSTREFVAGQALSNLSIGRTNADAGFGGLVLTAGNESINVLLRALKSHGTVRVLSRPQIMTLDNQLAQVQVGASVSRITGSSITEFGTTSNQVEDVDIGLILQVQPRTSPDGLVSLILDIENSSLGNEADGTVVAVDPNGTPIRSPQINRTFAQTTLVARSGQTVVMSGLLTKSTSYVRRGIPIISDLPILGIPFRFESEIERRTELLIIMTPYIIKDDEDYEWIKLMESERMHWCLSDVMELHGDVGLGGPGYFDGTGPHVIYPDVHPSAELEVPTPATPQLEPEPVPNANQSSHRETVRPNDVRPMSPANQNRRFTPASQIIRNTMPAVPASRRQPHEWDGRQNTDYPYYSDEVAPAYYYDRPTEPSQIYQRSNFERPSRLPHVN